MTKKEKKLQEFFEGEGFSVYLFRQDNQLCAELEKWTDGGVDMIITLMPFSSATFIEYVNDYEIDELIDLHRQDERYKKAFTISESLTDFQNFKNSLLETVKKLNTHMSI